MPRATRLLARIRVGARSASWHRQVVSVLQPRPTAPEPEVPDAGGMLREAVTGQNDGVFLEHGGQPPNPRGLTHCGPNNSAIISALERRIGQRRGATRAPTQVPEWQGRLRPSHNPDPPIQSKAYCGHILVLKTGATLLSRYLRTKPDGVRARAETHQPGRDGVPLRRIVVSAVFDRCSRSEPDR